MLYCFVFFFILSDFLMYVMTAVLCYVFFNHQINSINQYIFNLGEVLLLLGHQVFLFLLHDLYNMVR